jgi:CBS domain-containing protein
MKTQTVEFLSQVKPFDLLPAVELERIADELMEICFPKGSVLFHQKISTVTHIHIVKEGRLERFIEEGEEKRLRMVLNVGDVYGGISILMNKGTAIRSLQSMENATCYILPKNRFLELCGRYDEFSDFFTSTFGKQMLDRCYAAMIAKSAQEETDEVFPDFLSRPLEGIYSKDFASCEVHLSIREAAKLMTEYRRGYILIKDPTGEYTGLITDNDLRRKVVATAYDINRPVRDIMESPLISVAARAQVFEAVLLMLQRNIKHLTVINEMGKTIGIVTDQDLLVSQGHSPIFLIREIHTAKTLDELAYRHEQLPGMVKSLVDSGAKAKHLNNIITEMSDTILKKVVDFAISELGDPPARFAFMILGSEGRKEQTLKTDQDNAIVFEDLPPESLEKARIYFLKFGEKVCGYLDQVGYSFCEFDVMAKNPMWCQPLRQWKDYFWQWTRKAEPLDLLKSSIFFDFRLGYGDQNLVDELQKYLFDSLAGWLGFFRHLSENALEFRPPIDFFGKISLVSKGEHQNTVDIKSAMNLIVDFARVYALHYQIKATNTLERLHEMYRLGALNKQDHDDLAYVYSFLMQMRLTHQVKTMMEDGGKPNNYVNPKSLSHIEQQTLKEALKHLGKAQGKLSMDFAGVATGIG